MVLVYMDDCIFFGKDSKKIDEVIEQLQQWFKLTVDEMKEDAKVDVFSYLGVQILINKTGIVIFNERTQNLQILWNARPQQKWTLASTTLLGMDAKGQWFDAKWDYATTIGMLLYLSSNSHPNIQFTVHQCVQFMHTTK